MRQRGLIYRGINMKLDQMPKLRPIPINTAGKSFVGSVKTWLFKPRKWELLENWFYTLPNGRVIMIPKGFILDGASIPRIFWNILNPVGILLIPALPHDYGYKYDCIWTITEDGTPTLMWNGAGKSWWDKLFRDMALEVNGIKAVAMVAYNAVRFGAFLTWRKYRKENAISDQIDGAV